LKTLPPPPLGTPIAHPLAQDPQDTDSFIFKVLYLSLKDSFKKKWAQIRTAVVFATKA